MKNVHVNLHLKFILLSLNLKQGIQLLIVAQPFGQESTTAIIDIKYVDILSYENTTTRNLNRPDMISY